MTSSTLPASVVRFQRRPYPARPALPPGVPDLVLDAYRQLAERGELPLPALAEHLAVPPDRIRAVADELARLRLVHRTDDGGLVAVPGSQAIDDLLAEQAGMLARALNDVTEGQRRLQTLVRHRSALDLTEAARISSTTLGGPDRRGMFDLPGEAVEAISAMNPGGTFSDELLDRSLSRAAETVRRNVRMRVIHQTSALRHANVAGYLAELSALGCRVRVRDSLPFRLLLIDGVSAVCMVPGSGSYLLRGERVMVLLDRIFESTWVDADPLERALTTGPVVTAGPPSPACGLPWGGGEGHRADTIDVADPGRTGPDGPRGGPDGQAHGHEGLGHGGAGQPRPGQGHSGGIPVHVAAALGSAHQAVLRLLAEGHTDQSIARVLGVTTRTVGRRVNEIYQVLEVDSRFQAGIRARELGIV